MSNHFRHCPKHRKLLPCSHCALAAKPGEAPSTAVAVMDGPKEVPATNAEVSVVMPNVPATEPEIPNFNEDVEDSVAESVLGKVVKCVVPGCSVYTMLPFDKVCRVVCRTHARTFCIRHGELRPCSACIEELALREQKTEEWKQSKYARILRKWREETKQGETKPSISEPVVPVDVNDWSHSFDSSYDTELYRKEINMGLAYAKKVLRDFGSEFDDLKQIVEIEVWLASKNYGDQMNGALAYRIAKNQAGKFLTRRVEESRGRISLDDKGKDKDGKPKEISKAEEQVSMPQRSDVRINGEAVSGNFETSPEFLDVPKSSWIWGKPQQPNQPPSAWMSNFVRKMPELEKLVAGWYGAKRAVGEAVLRDPECTVREVPGVPKTTVARVMKVVLAEFRAIVDAP